MPRAAVSFAVTYDIWCATDRFLLAFQYDADDPKKPGCTVQTSLDAFRRRWRKPYYRMPLQDGGTMLVLECTTAREVRKIDYELDLLRFRLTHVRRRLSDELRAFAYAYLDGVAHHGLRIEAEEAARERGLVVVGSGALSAKRVPTQLTGIAEFIDEAHAVGFRPLHSWREKITVGAVLLAAYYTGTFETQRMKVVVH